MAKKLPSFVATWEICRRFSSLAPSVVLGFIFSSHYFLPLMFGLASSTPSLPSALSVCPPLHSSRYSLRLWALTVAGRTFFLMLISISTFLWVCSRASSVQPLNASFGLDCARQDDCRVTLICFTYCGPCCASVLHSLFFQWNQTRQKWLKILVLKQAT